uniref:Late embryogenesis abundant protein LEA-2 subgroup domain-containing protein n=1 Tax=Kalanchoe fedtschenkoi TaxID=63787 RepID=A0A7N0TKY6_KALFE
MLDNPYHDPTKAPPQAQPPPPYHRNVPRYQSKRKSNNYCLKCICCCYCVILLIILILAAAAVYFLTVARPQVPTYKVESLDVASFDAQMDFSLYAEFVVTVRAENPNAHIAFVYGEDSSLVVEFQDSVLCSGKLPAFYQGYQDTSIMKIVLKGKSTFGSGLQEALMDSRHAGRIPLLVMVRVPVVVEVLKVRLQQIYVLMNCTLVVDRLMPRTKPQILSSNYTVSVRSGDVDLNLGSF